MKTGLRIKEMAYGYEENTVNQQEINMSSKPF